VASAPTEADRQPTRRHRLFHQLDQAQQRAARTYISDFERYLTGAELKTFRSGHRLSQIGRAHV
jgi:16S rRNA U516 pseudouridylate synthase RsuA-like enzyme